MITVSEFLKHLPPRPVVLEAGAHHGLDTVKLAQKARQVYAFEPSPKCYAKAVALTARLPNVKLSPTALGGTEGTQSLWVSGNGGQHDGSSSLRIPAQHLSLFPHVPFDSEPITVPVQTIEAWAQREGVQQLDGAWLDMQGAELDALQAAGPILKTVQTIMMEISVVELYKNCAQWPEVSMWLEAQGFKVTMLDLYDEYSGDILAVRK